MFSQDLDSLLLGPKFLNVYVLKVNFNSFYLYLIAPAVFTLGAVLTNSKELFRQLRVFFIENERLNQFVANLKYIIFRTISFVLTFVIFRGVLKGIINLNEYFKNNKQFVFDWLSFEGNGVDNYNRGVYFSLLLTIAIFFLFNNSFIKQNSGSWNYREINSGFIKYFFIAIILCLGLFFGFFSIFNAIYNIFNSSLTKWISKENILGILPIRIASIMIVSYLLSYVYGEVINNKLLSFLILGILPIRHLSGYYDKISFDKRETLFFSQISFYILNIGLAEFFIIIGFQSVYLSILNFSILFIIDDFKIISDYSEGMRKVLPSHFVRIWFFNIIMFTVAITLLIANHYFILIIYLVITGVLFYYYFKNFSSITLKSPLK